jgi:hypothetical protein
MLSLLVGDVRLSASQRCRFAVTGVLYREEFDPRYDGDQKAGYPFCQEEPSPPPKGCDADYHYKKRPERVKDAVGRGSLTGKIGKVMLTLLGCICTWWVTAP